MKEVLDTLRVRKRQLEDELHRIERAIQALDPRKATVKPPTEEARKNMSDGQKRRHAREREQPVVVAGAQE